MDQPQQEQDRPVKQRPLARLAILQQDPPTHRMSTEPVAVDGRSYRLFRAVPVADAPPDGFPILTMLDGNGAFDFLTPELLAGAPGLVVVGIGYETPYRFETVSRTLDFSPAWSGGGPRPDPERPERMIGGADLFLDRLTGPLRAAAELDVAVDPARRTIWGHSMAGLFALYAALARPEAFARHAAISPSVWWGGGMLLDYERHLVIAPAHAKAILVMLSDSERRSSPSGPHWNGPAPHTLELTRRLASRPRLTVESQILPGLAHAETLPASLERTLRFAAETPGGNIAN